MNIFMFSSIPYPTFRFTIDQYLGDLTGDVLNITPRQLHHQNDYKLWNLIPLQTFDNTPMADIIKVPNKIKFVDKFCINDFLQNEVSGSVNPSLASVTMLVFWPAIIQKDIKHISQSTGIHSPGPRSHC
jgi:hypothetical protein